MKRKTCERTDVQIAYIGGGSKEWAWKLMTDLAMEPQLSGTVRLYDIDRPAAEKNAAIGNRLSARDDTPGKWKYSVSGSLKEALTGADFVLISILPGTFEEMRSDVHLPEREGIFQSVGDTAGPGGMIRALRTIPMFVEIVRAIRAYSPRAWVINYTNPMSLCVQILYHVFPDIKAFGCCHEVFGTQELLGKMCRERLGLDAPVPRQEIHVNVIGINHFTWFTRASYNGIDLFPLYRDFVEQYAESGFVNPKKPWTDSYFYCAHRVKFDLFRRYGFIAAAGDRHLAEFLPPVYLKDPQTVAKWMFHLTKVDDRVVSLRDRLARMDRLAAGCEELELKPTGEETVAILKALLGMGRLVSNVNLPNAGQIPNLPLGAVVETNALFECDSVSPISTGNVPDALRALMMPHLKNHRLILRAALECDREPVLQAFLNDPLAGPRLTEQSARQLIDDMILNTAAYLSDGWKE